jgi:hypothetical protein
LPVRRLNARSDARGSHAPVPLLFSASIYSSFFPQSPSLWSPFFSVRSDEQTLPLLIYKRLPWHTIIANREDHQMSALIFGFYCIQIHEFLY